MVVVCVSAPETPVMVTVRVPVVAELLVINVNAPLPVGGFGLKGAVTPLPRPEADKITLPANPSLGVTTIVVSIERCMTNLLIEGSDLRGALGVLGPVRRARLRP